MDSTTNTLALRTCLHCGVPYSWGRSPASLKMTYCGSLCEKADLGFSLEQLERLRLPTAAERAEAVAAGAWDAWRPIEQESATAGLAV